MERIEQKRIMPVVILDRADQAEPVAEALLAGGLDVMEITFRTEAAPEAIRRIARAYPDMLLGAGTLLKPDDAVRAAASGAQFAVAPGLNPEVVQTAQAQGLVFAPGVMTPSDVEAALALGCRWQKFFPAEAAGGVAMLKALWGPYAHTGVRFIPTGGISAKNLADYLVLPATAAVGGSWMVERGLIAGENWTEITRRTREALDLVAAAS